MEQTTERFELRVHEIPQDIDLQADALLDVMFAKTRHAGLPQSGSRELSLAKTHLEQATMWAKKHWKSVYNTVPQDCSHLLEVDDGRVIITEKFVERLQEFRNLIPDVEIESTNSLGQAVMKDAQYAYDHILAILDEGFERAQQKGTECKLGEADEAMFGLSPNEKV